MTTPRGELVLRRVDGAFEVISNGVFLMDTRDGRSERALVRAAVARHPEARRLLVGGLGVGFSLLEAVATPGLTDIDVVEIEPVLVGWHETHLRDLTGSALHDPRVTVLQRDVRDHLRASPGRYDIVCLDVDNGPGWTVTEDNAELYSAAGLATCVEALAPARRAGRVERAPLTGVRAARARDRRRTRGGRGRGGPRRARRRLPGRPQVRAAFAFMSRRSSGGSANSRLSSAERDLLARRRSRARPASRAPRAPGSRAPTRRW